MDFILQYLFLIAIVTVLFGISTWKLFQKMGKSPALAFVPFLNYYTVLKETGNPAWWCVLAYLPIVGPIMMSVFHVLLMKKFGKGLIQHQLMTVFLPFIYMAVVNYSKDSAVEDKDDNIEYFVAEDEEPKKKESFLGSITFAVVFATIIHVFIAQPFTIPTGSMERTLMVGDFLFVNKLNYGLRMPMRPLAIPFLQGTIMDTGEKGNPKDDPKSYVDAVRLPYFRLPGWEKVERNDIVVFNYPQDSVHTAIDRKDPYVKRCVAVGGDTVEMRAGRLFVNGQAEHRLGDAEVEHDYVLQTKSEVDFNSLVNRYGALNVIQLPADHPVGQEYIKRLTLDPQYPMYKIQMTEKMAEEFKQLPDFISIKEDIAEKGKAKISYYDQNSTRVLLPYSIFPYTSQWNEDWYGPLTIPKKGAIIPLSPATFAMYQPLITKYEGHTLQQKDGQILLDGKPATQYTVQQDYYFMMGDNRDGSLDARFFGFVPETHIVGKPMFTWMSVQGLFTDQTSQVQAPFKLRFDRMFKATNTGDPNKTSYWWIAALILTLFFGWEYFAKLFKKKKDD